MNPSATRVPEQTPGTQTCGTEANPPQALPGLLRAHAAGLLADVAAVDLLIAHRYWLARPAFTARFVHPVTAADGHPSAPGSTGRPPSPPSSADSCPAPVPRPTC